MGVLNRESYSIDLQDANSKFCPYFFSFFSFFVILYFRKDKRYVSTNSDGKLFELSLSEGLRETCKLGFKQITAVNVRFGVTRADSEIKSTMKFPRDQRKDSHAIGRSGLDDKRKSKEEARFTAYIVFWSFDLFSFFSLVFVWFVCFFFVSIFFVSFLLSYRAYCRWFDLEKSVLQSYPF